MQLPDPLTPPDCDLRGFDFMPLLGHRLFSSKWYSMARKNSRAGIAALKLWWVSFLQLPAGSLPNDDDELCMLADFGDDMRSWSKHKSVAMHGFVLCSDNRWYHPVVAEEAMDSYAKRIKWVKGKERDAERLRQWRINRKASDAEWEAIRVQIFKRDDYTCQICGVKRNLHCCHMIALADGGNSDFDNLTTMCGSCQTRKSNSATYGSRTERNEMRFETQDEAHCETRRTGTYRQGHIDRDRTVTPPTPPAGGRRPRFQNGFLEVVAREGMPDTENSSAEGASRVGSNDHS